MRQAWRQHYWIGRQIWRNYLEGSPKTKKWRYKLEVKRYGWGHEEFKHTSDQIQKEIVETVGRSGVIFWEIKGESFLELVNRQNHVDLERLTNLKLDTKKEHNKAIEEERQRKQCKTTERTERFPTREWQLDQHWAYQQINGSQGWENSISQIPGAHGWRLALVQENLLRCFAQVHHETPARVSSAGWT